MKIGLKIKKAILAIIKVLPKSWFNLLVNQFYKLKNKACIKVLNVESTSHLKSSFPIDIVYTWVNSNDLEWLKKKNDYTQGDNDSPNESNVASRFRENEELKFSLRSVLLNAKWVQTIYIVTDNQIPNWYKAFDNRVQFVSHETIFLKKADLPTFNSHAIESNLHRIPGLSEHFLYFNDDFFLRSPVEPSDFFSDDGIQTKFFWSNQVFIPDSLDEKSVPVDIAARNNVVFLEQNYGHTTNRKFKHMPMALKKSVLEQLESEHPEIFISNSAARFRSNYDYSIVSALIHHYGYALKIALPSNISYLYASFDDELFEFKLNLLLLRRFKCFCINDVEVCEDVLQHVSKTFTEKMELLFPIPSPYEKSHQHEQ